ncbi:hypothetical protein QOZ80_6AG0537130 [Eleusine coracana subsp. coracana]|nr:hypothetical protein QOZ80_6AG0537130 [Eleusine coracana subsp. coracana]
MIQSQVCRVREGQALPCLVRVEDVNSNDHYAGSVILKTTRNTYVLTQSRPNQLDTGFQVHFSDDSVVDAERLAFDEQFAVLSVGMEHEQCTEIMLEDPANPSDALIFLPSNPNDMNMVSKIQGFKCFIPLTSWPASNDVSPGHVIQDSDVHFLTTCFEGDTKMMKAVPIFTKDGSSTEAFGVIIGDCSSGTGIDGAPQKICLKGSSVEERLRRMLNTHNWRGKLSTMGIKKKEKKDKAMRDGWCCWTATPPICAF